MEPAQNAKSTPREVKEQRDRSRAQGLRPVHFWAPGVRTDALKARPAVSRRSSPLVRMRQRIRHSLTRRQPAPGTMNEALGLVVSPRRVLNAE